MRSSCSTNTSIVPALLLATALRCLALSFAAWTSLATLHAQSDYATPYTFITLAGSGGNSSSKNGTGTAASFLNPSAVAVDGSGNLYVADTGNNLIRKITSAGVVTTLAGSAGVFGRADGLGSAASFYRAQGIAVDSSGNVYVADEGNSTIRKITPEGMVTTFANVWENPPPGSPVRFNNPLAVAVDGSGNVYVADDYSSTIRKITSTGVISTLAGTAWVRGSKDGTGSAASFSGPQGIAVDASGNIYVADTYQNSAIRKITPTGVVTTLAGNIYSRGSADGIGTKAEFGLPRAVSVDSSGNIYVADSFPYENPTCTIRKVTPDGVVTTLAGGAVGNTDGFGTAAKFNNALGVAVDNAGNVYVADAGNQTIRRMTSVGDVTTFAGAAGTPGFVSGPGVVARFNRPGGVAVDSAGNVLIADMGNHAIRSMTPAGVVTTAKAGPEGFVSTRGLAVDGAGNSYSVYGTCQIAKTSPSGVVTIIAGMDSPGSADGPGPSASFRGPQGLAVDAAGNVYVADSENCTVRKISIAGDVSTLAGMAGNYGSTDDAGSAARFSRPSGIAVDVVGNLYVVDQWNHTVRRVTPAGVVTTLAGLANNGGDADGIGSAARFNWLTAIAVDGTGNIFVTDTGNHNIRKITPEGVVTTLGGQTEFADFSTGVGPVAHFLSPVGIAVDSLGRIYVADSVYNSIIVGGILLAPANAVIAITVE